MIKYGVLGAIFILVAAAVVATFQPGDEVIISSSVEADNSGSNFGQRISALEEALAEERNQRIQLQAEVANLKSSSLTAESSDALAPNTGRFALVGEDGIPENLQEIRAQIEDRRNATRANAEGRQLANLIEAGFDEFQAEEIIRTTEEMQMNLLNARFEASQSGEDFDAGEIQAQATAEFRSSLGDADYERYLEATNQSTSVDVTNVLASSPAENSGMQSGDQIISYNGERVFNTNDLTRLSSSVQASGNVVVEVLRDGQPVSLSMPTGPIGITSGRGGNNRIR